MEQHLTFSDHLITMFISSSQCSMMIKGKVPAHLPRIGGAVICNGKYAV